MEMKRHGTNAVTLSDVAAFAGVSVSAVSKVLLGGGGKTTKVGEATAEKIKAAAARLGYSPNAAARQLKTGKSGIIGALIHSAAPQVYYDLLGRIQKRLADLGCCFMIGQSDGRVELVERYLEEFRSRGADVIVSAMHEYHENTERVKAAHVKFGNMLYLGRPDMAGAAYVEPDIADGVARLVGHLVSRGARRIALAIPDYPSGTISMRRAGYRRGLEEHALPFDESLLFGYPWALANPAPALARKALETGVEAVIASNDMVALRFVREFRALGVRVPEDIKVTGFDNMEFATLVTPSLTTIDTRNEECAAAVANMVIGFLATGVFPESVVIRPKLIVGESA